MSLNHFCTDNLIPETLYWTQFQQQSLMEPNRNPNPNHHFLHHHHHSQWLNYNYNNYPTQNPPLNFNLNSREDNINDLESSPLQEQDHDPDHDQYQDQEREQDSQDGKEPMFEKPLTPSDVGKLNRLVIPKQHAEKYFPLNNGGGGGDKGLLLSFEDEVGKCWRFRYSYWNSSQSYVLTKGWSRYVKEKQLDAGDVVLFERHRRDGDRLFIGWRRRGGDGVGVQGSSGGVWSRGLQVQSYPPNSSTSMLHGGGGANVITTTTTRSPYEQQLPQQQHPQIDCLHAGSSTGQNQNITAQGNSRTLRLFGVDLECQLLDESEPLTPEVSSLSSQGPAAHQQFFSQSAYSSNSSGGNYSHMDVAFSRDVNQMRNRRG